ncbi:hypothetical protein ElyMa_006492800 [Elysia marginata]|uniref:Uncharacterized protein n=1 Tax=Elysia marginata TaxID=1093978 RepID=A0AAV4I5D6_9GAST|nr:hypothetical protein ElyMa_006492800 [Elysia marginata]
MQEEEKKKSAATSSRDNRRGQTPVKITSGPGSEGGSSVSSAVPVGVMYYESPTKAGREQLDLAVKGDQAIKLWCQFYVNHQEKHVTCQSLVTCQQHRWMLLPMDATTAL